LTTEVIERDKLAGPGGGIGGNCRVIVKNDDHNSFDHVANVLARYLPGVSVGDGFRLADTIHNSGLAIVWVGQREIAELYWQQLRDAGLTMAPLEDG